MSAQSPPINNFVLDFALIPAPWVSTSRARRLLAFVMLRSLLESEIRSRGRGHSGHLYVASDDAVHAQN